MDELMIKAAFFCVVLAGAFSVGIMYGRDAQCQAMGAEYRKDKCVMVQRTEVKP